VAPRIDMEELAASYGWSYAVLQSNPELRRIFQRAVKESWTAPRFVAAIRNTKWYRTHGESARQALILQKTDPAEWNRRVKQMRYHIRAVYGEIAGGMRLNPRFLDKAAVQAVMFGWTEEEVRFHVARATDYGRLMNQGRLGGQAGQLEQFIRRALGEYGVKASNRWIATRIKNSMMGLDSQEAILETIKRWAKAQYRAFADDIDRGMTVQDIAEPYRQSMARLLELNPESVDLNDSMIRRALTATDQNGKPVAMPLWEFENKVREDPRWVRTKNAQDTFMSVGRSILTQMGLVA